MLVAKTCPTLFVHMDYSRQVPLSMGFSRPEYWSGLPSPSPGDLPDPGIELRSPALQADSLPSEPPGSPLCSRLRSLKPPVSSPLLLGKTVPSSHTWVRSQPLPWARSLHSSPVPSLQEPPMLPYFHRIPCAMVRAIPLPLPWKPWWPGPQPTGSQVTALSSGAHWPLL